jgi:ketosteroid isomerase-like protein
MAEDMEQAKERLRQGYEAFNRGDFDESAKYLHPEVDWDRVADVEQRLEGREAVRGNMEPDVWGKQHVEIHAMEVFGESVVMDTTFHAEGAGSGIEINQRGYHLWKMRDGMGARFQFFNERDEAVKAAREQEGLSE